MAVERVNCITALTAELLLVISAVFLPKSRPSSELFDAADAAAVRFFLNAVRQMFSMQVGDGAGRKDVNRVVAIAALTVTAYAMKCPPLTRPAERGLQ